MTKRLFGLAAFIATVICASSASAAVYQDDLSRCLLDKTTDADRTQLMEWAFAAMASNPQLKSLSAVTPEQSKNFTREAAVLMQRLILDDCRKQSIDALKYEGDSAFEKSFGELGLVAMRGLMSDPATKAQLNGLVGYLDKDRWTALGKEAGVSAAGISAATPDK